MRELRPLLVYLDTSHLHLLGEARARELEGYAAFVAEWRTLGCELVLTVYHLLEMRVLAHADTRAARYAVFRDLAPVRLDVQNADPAEPAPSLLTEREIVRAFVRHEMLKPAGSSGEEMIASWTEMFPGRLATADEATALQVLEADIFDFASAFAKKALEIAAGAQARPAGTRYPEPRLGDLPSAPLTPEAHAAAAAQLDAAFADPLLRARFGALLPPEATDTLMEAARAFSRQMLDRQADVGPQQAVAEFLDARGDRGAPRRRLDALQHRHLFESQVADVVAKLAPEADADHRRAIGAGVALTDCPGTWLQAAIETDLLKNEPTPPTSTRYDLGHVGHLPYVDLMFADRRIVRYAEQVLGRADRPALLRADHLPRRAHAITGVMQAIRAVALGVAGA